VVLPAAAPDLLFWKDPAGAVAAPAAAPQARVEVKADKLPRAEKRASDAQLNNEWLHARKSLRDQGVNTPLAAAAKTAAAVLFEEDPDETTTEPAEALPPKEELEAAMAEGRLERLLKAIKAVEAEDMNCPLLEPARKQKSDLARERSKILQQIEKAQERMQVETLREVLENPLTAELIGVSELENAERELERMMIRNRRAAFERLGAAAKSKDIDKLQAALQTAKTAGLGDTTEVQKAERELAVLEGALSKSTDFGTPDARTPGSDASSEDARERARANTLDSSSVRTIDPETVDFKPPPRLATAVVDQEKKTEAFKLLMQDNVEGLEEFLEPYGVENWSHWRNKGGKSLLEMAEERSKEHCHSFLLKALDRVTTLAAEDIETGDAVWVFEPGELQPHKATAVEFSPDFIVVTYWDSDKAEKDSVPRGRVRRMRAG